MNLYRVKARKWGNGQPNPRLDWDCYVVASSLPAAMELFCKDQNSGGGGNPWKPEHIFYVKELLTITAIEKK